MARQRRYTAHYTREDGWWIVRILEARGVHSNGRTLKEARRRVREALSLDIGDTAFSVEFTERIALPPKCPPRALAPSDSTTTRRGPDPASNEGCQRCRPRPGEGRSQRP